jgi:O-antigen/teichoic acid export membrane protein
MIARNTIMECELAASEQNSSGVARVTAPISVFNGAVPTRDSVVIAPLLRVSFSWTLAGSIIYTACQFGVLSALAKLGSTSVVGEYALGLAISAPVFMLTNLQLRGVQATDARHEFAFCDYFTLRVMATLVGLLAIITITAFSGYDFRTKAVIALVGCAKAVETVSDVIAGHLQKFERLDQVAHALILRGTLSVAVFSIVFWLTRNLVSTIIALALTWLVSVGLYDCRIVCRLLGSDAIFFRWCPHTLKRLIAVSWPLGVVMTLLSLNINVPRYILVHRLGKADLGIFALLSYLLTAMNLIVTALGQSVCTRLSRLFANGDVHRFQTLVRKLIAFGFALGVIGVGLTIVAGRPVLTVLYGAEYARHLDLLLVLVCAASVNTIAAFFGYGMTAARCFREQVPIVASAVAATVVLTVLLLPRFGLLSAGYGLLAAAGIQTVANRHVLRAKLKRLPGNASSEFTEIPN